MSAIVRPAKAPPSNTSAIATPRYTYRFGSSGDVGSGYSVVWKSHGDDRGAAEASGTRRALARSSIVGRMVPSGNVDLA